MRRLVLLALVVAIVPAALSGSAAGRPGALSCGLPETQPVWIDFADGSTTFWRQRFGRPGVVVATGGPGVAGEARQLGAATVHWDMYLRKRVGTPSEPADPGLMEKRADALFDYAVETSGCQQPLIALNELWGSSLPSPLTPTAERYRSNVLRFVTRLAERGGRPALLVSSEPFTGTEAAEWWRAVSRVSDLVLESYSNANVVWREGAVNGSRRLRAKYRQGAAKLLAIGVPSSRIGLMIGFQTGSGVGGREGLAPRSRWFSVAKWQALAARQLARELRLAHVWSWGWAQRNERSNDPDKTYAACVWLWARDTSLCDAPRILGDELDTDLRAGQIDLPAGIRCVYGDAPLASSSVGAIGRVAKDAEVALTALVVRAVERERTDVTTAEILAAEKRIVAARFGGRAAAYRAALAQAGATLAVGRAIVGDELRRQEIVDRLSISRPTSVDVARFRATHALVPARAVTVTPAPSWLPEGTGVALATTAPERLFLLPARRSTTIRTAEGVFEVRPLARVDSLGALSLADARPAIVRELAAQRRADAYAEWTIRRQKGAESRLVCARDRLPELGVVTLSSFVPFLSLNEPEAARWLAAQRSSAKK
jgi:hypothetical protein